MPVRFHCPICQQLLSVASRKVGSKVTCPKCQFSILVPEGTSAQHSGEPKPPQLRAGGKTAAPKSASSTPTTPPATDAGGGKSRDAPTHVEAGRSQRDAAAAALWISDSIVFDDIPAVLASAPMPQPEPDPALSKKTASESASPAPRSDGQFVAVSRRMLHLQGVIIMLISLAALAAGYYIGRGSAPIAARATPDEVTVAGHISYPVEGSQTLPDAQAVVIAFPQGSMPGDKIPIAGLRPDDPVLPQANDAVRKIESSAGLYRRANAQGQFELQLPPGVYRLLVISRHVQRPGGAGPKPEDVAALDGYFQSPSELLGPWRYELVERKLPDEAPLEISWNP